MAFLPGDRVRTEKTNRGGRVRWISADHSEATVLWDDGDEFSIRTIHLRIEEPRR